MVECLLVVLYGETVIAPQLEYLRVEKLRPCQVVHVADNVPVLDLLLELLYQPYDLVDTVLGITGWGLSILLLTQDQASRGQAVEEHDKSRVACRPDEAPGLVTRLPDVNRALEVPVQEEWYDL